jgi:hypothetical protein
MPCCHMYILCDAENIKIETMDSLPDFSVQFRLLRPSRATGTKMDRKKKHKKYEDRIVE